MRWSATVAVTDYDWFRFLASRPGIDEVNFWQPSGAVEFKALQPGDLFLFKLRRPRDFVVVGGFFATWSRLPVRLAWETFREKNGVGSLLELRTRLARLRPRDTDPQSDYQIGCVLLAQPFFLADEDWIPAPADWARNIVRGKSYDGSRQEGRQLGERVMAALQARSVGPLPLELPEPQTGAPRHGKPILRLPRLGQGTFRVWVQDLYDGRCAVTGERTLPALEAAHIQPYEQAGPHDPRNGLLLRTDLHRLFDSGYATVTSDLRFWVSDRIRAEFLNGRDYYEMNDRQLMEAGKTMSEPEVSIEALSTEEQLELLERLWNSLSKEPSNVPLTALQRAELDRRLDSPDEDVQQDRVLGVPWDEVVRQIRTRG